MILVNDIYNFLDRLYPFDKACEFDNAGLLVGNKNKTVTKILVTLDCTQKSVKKAIAIGAELIVTHHPAIFTPIKSILSGSPVFSAVKNDISVISAHTNLDLADGGVNDCLARTLELQNVEKVFDTDGFSFRVGILKTPLSSDDFAKLVKTKLGISPRFNPIDTTIKKVAVCGGSGGDFFDLAFNSGADAYVTSEVKHHLFLEASRLGKMLLDATHFYTEDVVTDKLKEVLENEFEGLTVIADHTPAVKAI